MEVGSVRQVRCSVLDALERWGQGGVGCRWWLCVIRKRNGRLLQALAVGRGGKRRQGEGLERKCRLEVWEKCWKTQRKVKVWRADGGWKCEAGAGRSGGHVRRLSPTNSGGIGFVKVLMSESY